MNPSTNSGEKSIELHKLHAGKLVIQSKVPLQTNEDLTVAYTPGVGAVSMAIKNDPALASEYTLKRNSVAIVSDGSAVLGLGNIGPLGAIPVMEGKAVLFKKFANIDGFPICLDTQDTEEIIETIKRIAPVFGGINLEDIAAPRCFEIEARLRTELDIPVMHDDQHGTAVVVLAGLINSLKVKGISAGDARVVLSGAGAAGTAIAKLLKEYGFEHITICDSKGIIHSGRTDLNSDKQALAELSGATAGGSLADAIAGADIFVGVSVAKALSVEMVKSMNPEPIIFALSNPEPEIMPDLAHSAGALIVATGRSDFPNQVNNVLAFPGIFRGALDNKVRLLDDQMFLRAAQSLADLVLDPTTVKILPSPFEPGVSSAVASAITNS
ncbi:MAG TPA: NADP-dependent malic enzyme [Patescibacteria group bacterium]|jgi:malate dehydrogenase (oxaloacetate-decarboxylating)|nr:NADP-dependent malic enzyme [Patescibacteria group bacterium]